MKAFASEHSIPGYMDLKESGMDLRDYFAAKTIAPLIQYISCGYEGDLDNDDFICIANDAYKMADIMMKAREKNNATI